MEDLYAAIRHSDTSVKLSDCIRLFATAMKDGDDSTQSQNWKSALKFYNVAMELASTHKAIGNYEMSITIYNEIADATSECIAQESKFLEATESACSKSESTLEACAAGPAPAPAPLAPSDGVLLCLKRVRARVLNNLSQSLGPLDNTEALLTARKYAEESLQLHTEVYSPEDIRTINAKSSLSVILKNLGEFHRAVKLGQEVVEYKTRALGARHSETLSAINNVAIIYNQMGLDLKDKQMCLKAIEEFENLIHKMVEIVGEQHINTQGTMNALVGSYVDYITLAIDSRDTSVAAMERNWTFLQRATRWQQVYLPSVKALVPFLHPLHRNAIDNERLLCALSRQISPPPPTVQSNDTSKAGHESSTKAKKTELTDKQKEILSKLKKK